MKRLTQLLSIPVLMALAAQLVLASPLCSIQRAARCSSRCPMGMSSMNGKGVNCPMARSMAADACPSNCSTLIPGQAPFQAVAPWESPRTETAPVVWRGVTLTSEAWHTGEPDSGPHFLSPPLHLLYRVFRI